MDGEKGDLDILFTSPKDHSKGVGYAAWCEVEKIHTEKAPAAVGPYSQAIVTGGMVYTSGQIALDPKSGELVGKTIEEQAEQVMKNLVAILEKAGTKPENAVKTLWKVKDADFLLFYLGWDERWGTKEYFGDYPCIDDSVLDHILDGNYKGIGFDVIGLDPIADENLTRHKKLFKSKDIVNIENLCNLGKCGSELFWFSCFPLKIKDCDGSPIRAVAWFE